MTSSVYDALMDQKQKQIDGGVDDTVVIDGLFGFVFTSKTGMPMAPNAVNNILYNVVKSFNKRESTLAEKEGRKVVLMPNVSAHILRHTGCTRMAESGMDPKVLQYIMEHAEISITMDIYNHVEKDRVRREINRLEGNNKY